MSNTATLERQRIDAAPAQRVAARAKNDAAMLKAAASLTRDLNVPDARIYWADLLGSTLLGYAALVHGDAHWIDLGRACSRRCRSARALSCRQLHSRADAYQEGRRSRVPLGLERDRRSSAAGTVVHVRRRAQPAPRQDLLRDGQRSRISAAGADEAVDPAGIPDRRRTGADRNADPLRHPRAAVDAFAEAAARRRRPIFRSPDQSASSAVPRRTASSRATGR